MGFIKTLLTLVFKTYMFYYMFFFTFAYNAYLWGKCALTSSEIHQSTEDNVLHGHSFSVCISTGCVLNECAVSVKNYPNDILVSDC